MTQGSFSSKQIRVEFTLASGQFGAQLGNTKIVSDLRVICKVKKAGQPSKNECKLQIFGLLPEDMSQLATLGYNPLAVRKNLIRVLAGDSDGLATVFQGEISGAWINYHKPPDLFFEVHAVAGYYPALAPSNPRSIQGAVSAATLFQNLAAEMGYTFANHGVATQVSNPYLYGSAMTQASQLARMIDCEFGVDDGELFIAPLNIPRQNAVAYTSPTTGMKDYPIFNRRGIEVEMLFNPEVKLNGLIQVEGSDVQQANGVWRIHGLEHHLISRNHHHGAWHTRIHATQKVQA